MWDSPRIACSVINLSLSEDRKILTVAFTWLRVDEVPNGHTRYVLSMADYQRMTGAVKPLM